MTSIHVTREKKPASGSKHACVCPDAHNDKQIEDTVCQMATCNPRWGQYIVAVQLKKLGLLLTPARVRSIWIRHGLETYEKRLTALTVELVASGPR